VQHFPPYSLTPNHPRFTHVSDVSPCSSNPCHHALGYTFVTLSGGEPFLYPHLSEVLNHAKSLGLVTGLVTNGMFLDARRLDGLKPILDLVVVSLDGAPKRHNMMRANKAAFEVMAAKIPTLKESGIPFGFLFTLSRDNAHELDWAADFAADSGAAMMQVHPLEVEVGRAAETEALIGLDPDENAAVLAGRRAWEAQQRLGDAIKIVVDFRPRAPEEPKQSQVNCGTKARRFSDVVTMALILQVQRDADKQTAPLLQNMAQSLRRASHGSASIAAE